MIAHGDLRVVAACTGGPLGLAITALLVRPLLTVLIVLVWGTGLVVGLHVQQIREAHRRQEEPRV